MSKSKGNFLTVQGLIGAEESGGRGIDPMALRLTLISGHYRKPFNFTMDTLRTNVRHIQRLREAHAFIEGGKAPASGSDQTVDFAEMSARMLGAMVDDLNTPEAIAVMLEGIKRIMSGRDTFTASDLLNARNWLADVEAILGISGADRVQAETRDDGLAAAVDALLAERKAARTNRDFSRADAIRDELDAMGIEVMDSAEGVVWRKKLA